MFVRMLKHFMLVAVDQFQHFMLVAVDQFYNVVYQYTHILCTYAHMYVRTVP
jgi:hypothetical protein